MREPTRFIFDPMRVISDRFFIEGFRNLGLIETDSDHFLIIKENKLSDYLAQIAWDGRAIARGSAIFLFNTV
jgi:hypothetical protein